MGPRATVLPESPSYPSNRPTVPSVLSYYLALMVAWISAWLLHNSVGPGSQSEAVDTLFWTLAKLLVWLLPIPVIMRAWADRPVAAYLSLGNLRRGVQTGTAFALGFVVVSFVKDAFVRQFGLPTIGPGLLNALLIAPVCEEILFRGCILTALQDAGLRFWSANLLTSLLFLGMHLPGWYFMASPSLSDGVTMVGIILVGLGAGLSKQRSESLWGSVLFHGLNNLYSVFLR